MSEWDSPIWPFAFLLLVLAIMPAACLLAVKIVDWLILGASKLVRAFRRLVSVQR